MSYPEKPDEKDPPPGADSRNAHGALADLVAASSINALALGYRVVKGSGDRDSEVRVLGPSDFSNEQIIEALESIRGVAHVSIRPFTDPRTISFDVIFSVGSDSEGLRDMVRGAAEAMCPIGMRLRYFWIVEADREADLKCRVRAKILEKFPDGEY